MLSGAKDTKGEIAAVASSASMDTTTGDDEKDGKKVGAAGEGTTISVGPSSISQSSQSLAVDRVALCRSFF